MNINWKVRIKNKSFWISLIPLLIVLIQQIGNLFGYTIDLGETNNQIIEIVNIVFAILGTLGIIIDPTTAGFSDSAQALTYTEPKQH